MPKLNQTEIKESDISAYLATEDDFAFETSVFKACIDAGLKAEHGGTYRDPVTKKDRQFDIRALVREGKFTVRLAIECKNLRPYFPLLVSRVPLVTTEKYHEVIISGHRETNPLVTAFESTDTLRMRGDYSIFMQETFVGKSTTQIGRNMNQDLVGNDSEVFEKWAQAVASACGHVDEAADDYKASNQDVGATVVLPILIVPDETLWVADYTDEGTLLGAAKKTDSCLLYLGKEARELPFATQYSFAHLQIFTKSKFLQYLKKFVHGGNYWDSLFNDTKLEPAILSFQTKYA